MVQPDILVFVFETLEDPVQSFRLNRLYSGHFKPILERYEVDSRLVVAQSTIGKRSWSRWSQTKLETDALAKH